jgi:hypothetical protein
LVRNQIKRGERRGRNYFDRRTHEGLEALRIQAGLIDDQGGLESLTTAQLVAIRELCQAYYFDDGSRYRDVSAQSSRGAFELWGG